MEVLGLFLCGTSDFLQALEFPKAPVWHGSSYTVITKDLALKSQTQLAPDLSRAWILFMWLFKHLQM